MCNIFMIESHFQTSLKFSRLLLHVTFLPLRHKILACLCPIEMASQKLLLLFFFVILMLFCFSCLLPSHAFSGIHSLQFHGSIPPAALPITFLSIPSSGLLPCIHLSLPSHFHCHTNFKANSRKYTHHPFSSSKFTFKVFTKGLPHANTTSQHIDQRASLFLHISLSNS